MAKYISLLMESDSKSISEITDENKAAFNNIKDLVDGKTKNKVLFLYGETGTGKTHLLQAAANYLLSNSSRYGADI